MRSVTCEWTYMCRALSVGYGIRHHRHYVKLEQLHMYASPVSHTYFTWRHAFALNNAYHWHKVYECTYIIFEHAFSHSNDQRVWKNEVIWNKNNYDMTLCSLLTHCTSNQSANHVRTCQMSVPHGYLYIPPGPFWKVWHSTWRYWGRHSAWPTNVLM